MRKDYFSVGVISLLLLAGCSAPITPTSTPTNAPPPAPPTALPTSIPVIAATVAPSPTPAPATAIPTAIPTATSIPPSATPAPTAATAMLNGKPCIAPAALSPAQTEGPMYVADPPQRNNFQADAANKGGTALIFTGRILGADCKPIANARVDIWHTDAKGNYDLSKTYTSRGYVNADVDGRFRFDTIFPVIYIGRTAHLHLKITPPNGKTLTTQVYFPNEATNAGDAIFDPKLLARMSKSGGVNVADFDFVVAR